MSSTPTPVIPLLTDRGFITYDRCRRCGAERGIKCTTPRGIVTDTHAHRPTVEVERSTTSCQWFARCDRPAFYLIKHPVLDPVPTCIRCTDMRDLRGSIVGTISRPVSA